MHVRRCHPSTDHIFIEMHLPLPTIETLPLYSKVVSTSSLQIRTKLSEVILCSQRLIGAGQLRQAINLPFNHKYQAALSFLFIGRLISLMWLE
jgi:hypothetical protein